MHVQTVTGAIGPESITAVMHHEHLLSLTPGPWLVGGIPNSDCEQTQSISDQDCVAQAVAALRSLPGLGFNTVIDLSPHGVVGRSERSENVVLLKRISELSGINIVAGSSIYLESFSPGWTLDADIAMLTALFIRDATTGLADTGIRVGIYGEQATSLNEITPHEEKCLRAAVRATSETGLALTTHTTHGTMPLEQIRIASEEGMDLERLLVGHLDIPTAEEEILAVLDAGARVAFDTIGKQVWDFVTAPAPTDRADGEFLKRAYQRSDIHRAERVVRLIDAGYVGQILLGLDLTGAEVHLNPGTHGRWGYSYLAAVFVPLLREYGVTTPQIETMLHANPLALLTVGAN